MFITEILTGGMECSSLQTNKEVYVLLKNVTPYKIQLVQASKPGNRPRRFYFACTLLEKLEENENYVNRVCFSDEYKYY